MTSDNPDMNHYKVRYDPKVYGPDGSMGTSEKLVHYVNSTFGDRVRDVRANPERHFVFMYATPEVAEDLGRLEGIVACEKEITPFTPDKK